MRPALLVCALLPLTAAAGSLGLERGHVKLRGQLAYFPEDSLFRQQVGDLAEDAGSALRLNFRGNGGGLAVDADYQLLAVSGDQVALAGAFGDPLLARPVLPQDELRWLDLTHTVYQNSDTRVVQRLDRLTVGWTGRNAVLRVGRQAVSWGNGLFYNPMDFFNPFDPAAIDTEYKTGDDMVYGQYLLDSGSDWQAVAVQRRDEFGEASADARSWALKYHGFGAEREFDLLLAEHFGQSLLGIGGVSNLGEAVVRGDLVLVDGVDGWTTSAVVNASWSWVLGGHNMSGALEYFYNGFGLKQSEYDPQDIVAATDLLARIRRGELFSIGRHYLAGSVQVELTPLLNVTPAVFFNAGDGSALVQLSLRWDLASDWQLLGALNVPFGDSGTEFGGFELPQPGGADSNLQTGPSALVQIAFYF